MNIIKYTECNKAWYRPRHPVVALHDIGLVGMALALTNITSGYLQTYFFVVAAMFAVSAIHHWLPYHEWPHRLDRAMIQVMIAGTTLPYTQTLVENGGRWLLMVLWVWALTFFSIKLMFGCLMYRGVFPSCVYVVTGILGIVAMSSVGIPSTWWLVAAWLGVTLYALQLFVYNLQWLDFYPERFGYRESQHLILLMAVSCHTIAAFIYA